jgi:UDP-glucose 4-epimerase
MHLAAHSIVGESAANPSKYYENNVGAGLVLLDCMHACGVSRLVFSSTAAIYGDCAKQPIDEDQPANPSNPYGDTKLALERACHWYASAYGLKYTALRYFNAAGATRRCGEMHEPETHLIPIVLQVAAFMQKRSENNLPSEQEPHLELFGDDYPTSDGTCIRDYIHVVDLARAHVLAIDKLGQCSTVLNLGSGTGHTVREVIAVAERITGFKIPVKVAARRPGDPATLVASYDRIHKELGWTPTSDLSQMIESAWEWMQRRRPAGRSKFGVPRA